MEPIRVETDEWGRTTVTVHVVIGPHAEEADGRPVRTTQATSPRGRNRPARGRHHVTFAWPEEAVVEIGATFRRLRRDYGDPFADEGSPPGELTQSALLAGALGEAITRPERWLPSVRDDGRGRQASAQADGPTRKVSVVLTPGLRAQWSDFVDKVSDDAGRIWAPGFRPTRQNLALAAVQHQLPAAESWLPRRVG